MQQSSQTSGKQERHSEGVVRLKRLIKAAGNVLVAAAITGALYASIAYHAVDDLVALKKGRAPKG